MATAKKAPVIDPTVQTVIDTVEQITDDPNVQVTASKVTPRIGAAARNVLYTIGQYAGIIGAIAPVIAAALTGNAAIAVASVGAVGLALQSTLAKLNLSKTAEDIAKEAA